MLAFAPHSVCSVRNPVTPGLKMNVMTVDASNGTAQRAFHGLPNYPRGSAPLSAWNCGTRDRAVRLPTNRRFWAGRTRAQLALADVVAEQDEEIAKPLDLDREGDPPQR
jgi:hypothetical protein